MNDEDKDMSDNRKSSFLGHKWFYCKNEERYEYDLDAIIAHIDKSEWGFIANEENQTFLNFIITIERYLNRIVSVSFEKDDLIQPCEEVKDCVLSLPLPFFFDYDLILQLFQNEFISYYENNHPQYLNDLLYSYRAFHNNKYIFLYYWNYFIEVNHQDPKILHTLDEDNLPQYFTKMFEHNVCNIFSTQENDNHDLICRKNENAIILNEDVFSVHEIVDIEHTYQHLNTRDINSIILFSVLAYKHTDKQYNGFQLHKMYSRMIDRITAGSSETTTFLTNKYTQYISDKLN